MWGVRALIVLCSWLLPVAWGAGAGQVQVVENVPQHEVVAYSFSDKESPHYIASVPKVRNVILMIGDGMSAEHVWAAWLCNGGKLHLECLPYTGFSRTPAANRTITDSAAGGTAIACGEKTNNGMLGQAPDGCQLSSLAMRLAAPPYEKAGGIVVTKAITDATPAAFYAHAASRKDTPKIAADLLKSPFWVVVGGGASAFSVEDMQALKAEPRRYVVLYAPNDCPYAAQRGDALPTHVERTLAVLENAPNGFFLMIEGSEIDTASHAANLELAVRETLDFDKTLGVVLRWMQAHPDTLLVVTADHQTGGLSILDGSVHKRCVKGVFATTSHTGVAVPVYAAGPGAELFSGIMENTDFLNKVLRAVNR